jgi:hypothetical protein
MGSISCALASKSRTASMSSRALCAHVSTCLRSTRLSAASPSHPDACRRVAPDPVCSPDRLSEDAAQGMKYAPGICLSRVPSTAPFASASWSKWPSVVCLGVFTHAGRCEMS